MRQLLHIPLLIASLFAMTTSPSFAVFLPNLFQANIPIEQNTQSERNLALDTALFSTLTKITTQNINQKQKKQLQQAPWRFVSSYTIKKENQASHPNNLNINNSNSHSDNDYATQPETLIFHVQFNEQRLKTWLKKNKISFWDNYRPVTLVWLTIDNDMQKLIVGHNDQLTTNVLNKAAEKYGIPLQFPKVDVRDLKQITADDIWNFNKTALKKASQRYRPDAILAGRVFPTATGWETNWQLITHHNDQKLTWNSASEHLSAVLKTATGQLAHTLAQLYQSTGEEHQFIIEIQGIDYLKQYRDLTTYLAKQHIISQVHTKTIAADTVTLNITSNASEQQLLKILALSRKLITIEDQVAPSSALKFRWQG